MAKRTIKINIKLPAGVTADNELVAKATKAANDAVSDAIGDLVETQKLAKSLAEKGIHISARELLKHKKGKPAPKKASKTTGTRKRVVLSNAKRKQLIADLKAGVTIKGAAEKYGVSGATVMNIKTKAGLTNKRK
ncbi:hypothetical protein DDZ13_09465 [Coraliomargarita sinensis]|uniref:Uncharacterized protein n=1 Tax=Coraliomargarita sinensis TaxID=2174842 RepID=A0A317ZEZ3_9BACT|nr:hypothetical protein [Coraliomargarita sinensis]PXA03860.1 hypothetical protein DDZ13_09465 [Coraliomargarita sinensis]